MMILWPNENSCRCTPCVIHVKSLVRSYKGFPQLFLEAMSWNLSGNSCRDFLWENFCCFIHGSAPTVAVKYKYATCSIRRKSQCYVILTCFMLIHMFARWLTTNCPYKIRFSKRIFPNIYFYRCGLSKSYYVTMFERDK